MENRPTQQLERSINLWQLTLFGTGVYVLIGKVAENADYFTPWSFLLAALTAGVTAFLYAELSQKVQGKQPLF